MKNNAVINLYLNYVKEDMVDNFNATEKEMNKKIAEFNFLEMLQEEPDAVMHFDSSYWAEMIYFGKSLIRS